MLYGAAIIRASRGGSKPSGPASCSAVPGAREPLEIYLHPSPPHGECRRPQPTLESGLPDPCPQSSHVTAQLGGHSQELRVFLKCVIKVKVSLGPRGVRKGAECWRAGLRSDLCFSLTDFSTLLNASETFSSPVKGCRQYRHASTYFNGLLSVKFRPHGS